MSKESRNYNPGQSLGTLSKPPQIHVGKFPLHPLCNVDLKRPSHPESLQAVLTLLGGRVTKVVSYNQSNRLTQGIFHEFTMLCMVLLAVLRTSGQNCGWGYMFWCNNSAVRMNWKATFQHNIYQWCINIIPASNVHVHCKVQRESPGKLTY